MTAILDLERATAQCVRDVDQDFVRFEGFDDVAVGAHLERSVRQLGVIQPGYHHRSDVGMIRGHLHDEIQPRDTRHVHIGEHQRERLATHQTLGFLDVGRDHTFVAVAIQQSLQELTYRFLVVHHEHGRRVAIRPGGERGRGFRMICSVRKDRCPPERPSGLTSSLTSSTDLAVSEIRKSGRITHPARESRGWPTPRVRPPLGRPVDRASVLRRGLSRPRLVHREIPGDRGSGRDEPPLGQPQGGGDGTTVTLLQGPDSLGA